VRYLGKPCPETNEETVNFQYKRFDTLYAIKHIYRMSMECLTLSLICRQ